MALLPPHPNLITIRRGRSCSSPALKVAEFLILVHGTMLVRRSEDVVLSYAISVCNGGGVQESGSVEVNDRYFWLYFLLPPTMPSAPPAENPESAPWALESAGESCAVLELAGITILSNSLLGAFSRFAGMWHFLGLLALLACWTRSVTDEGQ